jgi:xylulokinase
MKYVVAHDVGTSSVKTVLINTDGQILSADTNHYEIFYSNGNWAEQNPEDYWKAIVKGTKAVIEKTEVNKDDVLGIIHTTQAMGIIPINKSGEVLRNNISWVDGRARKEARQVMNKLGGKLIFKKIAGTLIYGKDVIPKLLWIKNNEPKIYQETDHFLDVNGYLRFKATGDVAIEKSGACSYGYNLKGDKWLPIFKMAGIDVHKLPKVISSTDCVGTLTKEAAEELNLPQSVKVFGGCDDTQSAAIGSGAVRLNEAHIYLGTSAWLGVTVEKDYGFKNGAATLASGDPSKNILVGITESAGANIEWILRSFFPEEHFNNDTDLFNIFEREMTGVPKGANDLIMTPWFLGERAPVSTTLTRGTVFNLTHIHHRGHFARAACEGIGYNLRWIKENIKRDFKIDIDSIKVIGGGSANKSWMQGLADITKTKIITTKNPTHSGAIGAAMIAFVGLGIYDSFEEIDRIVKVNQVFTPHTDDYVTYDKLYRTYQKLYKSLHKTYQYINRKG